MKVHWCFHECGNLGIPDIKFTQADLCLGKYLNSLIEKKFGLIYYETHDLFYFLEVPCSVLNMPTTHEYHFLSIRLNQHSLVHVSLKGKLATILYNIPRQYIDNSKTKTAECGSIWIGMKNMVVSTTVLLVHVSIR